MISAEYRRLIGAILIQIRSYIRTIFLM